MNGIKDMLKTLRKFVTFDRGPADVLTTTRLGAKQALTPEGFLLCSDVPIKRTGEMIYGPGETPIAVGGDGVAHVTRDSAALFSDAAVLSYSGKPVVNEHPAADVNPRNWKRLAVGICLNPRRGVGDDADVMLADLLITDDGAIRDVQAGKREVSAGYEADYEQTGPGTGRQTNIIGNHVALVEKGRCGLRCSIGDHQPSTKEKRMGTATRTTPALPARRKTVSEAIRAAFKDAESELMQTLADPDLDGDESDGDHTHIHIHTNGDGDGGGTPAAAIDPAAGGGEGGEGGEADPTEARFAAIESTIAQIVAKLGELSPAAPASPPAAEGGEQGPTKDSAALQTSYQALVADAEVLVPGYRVPTFDAAAVRAVTVDTMCSQRRAILGHVYATGEGKSLVDSVSDSPPDLAKMTCDAVAGLFRAAAGAKKLLNNAGTAQVRIEQRPPTSTGSPVRSLSDLNKLHSKYYAPQAKH